MYTLYTCVEEIILSTAIYQIVNRCDAMFVGVEVLVALWRPQVCALWRPQVCALLLPIGILEHGKVEARTAQAAVLVVSFHEKPHWAAESQQQIYLYTAIYQLKPTFHANSGTSSCAYMLKSVPEHQGMG